MNEAIISECGRSAEIAEFYRRAGYGCEVGGTDTVFVARIDGMLVGVARLVTENATLVLRGMQVEEASQRRGIGSRLLVEAVDAIGDRECWCIPYTHLHRFYSSAGFEEMAPAASPVFLAERAKRYGEQGKLVVLMRRNAGLPHSPL